MLVALRAIVSGEKQEYYTDEMLKVFYEHANILSLPPEEASSILAPFYETFLTAAKPEFLLISLPSVVSGGYFYTPLDLTLTIEA